MSRRHKGFTLIELLIVIAIIGILIAAIAVAVTKAKEFANNNDQKANMKNLAQACRVAETGEGRLPPAWGTYGRPRSGMTTLENRNVFVHLLPYLENQATFNSASFGTNIKVFQSLMDPSATVPAGRTSFVANIRVFSKGGSESDYATEVSTTAAVVDTSSGLSTERIIDGPVNTILFTTKYQLCNTVANTYQSNPSAATGPFFGAANHFGNQTPKSDIPTSTTTALPAYQISPSLASSGTNVCNNTKGYFGHSFGGAGIAVAMGDASVRNVGFNVTGTTWARAVHPTDGLALGSDW